MENSGFPKVHPRHIVVGQVRNHIGAAIRKSVDEINPTYAELLMALAQETSTWASFQVRDERCGEENSNAH